LHCGIPLLQLVLGVEIPRRLSSERFRKPFGIRVIILRHRLIKVLKSSLVGGADTTVKVLLVHHGKTSDKQ